MRKIGIITFWGVPNYGAMMQNYALNSKIRSLYPECDVVSINYLAKQHWNTYYRNDERLFNSMTYSYNSIPHTLKLCCEQLESEYFDSIVCGSDCIWDFSIPDYGFDNHLIGNNLNTRRLIAYAASFGTMDLNSEFPDFIESGLKNYEKISVRDMNSRQIVNKLSGITPEIVLDPVLIWDYINDPLIVQPQYENYVLVYGNRFSEVTISKVVRYARDKNLKIISIGYINEWCDLSFKMIELRGKEWAGFFKNATFVVTHMFHGFMFSLAFNKPVAFDQVPFVYRKSEWLLEQLEMNKLFNTETFDFDSCVDFDWDYSSINKKLSLLRKTSEEYLEDALR